MDGTVFNRYELKYLLDEKTYNALQSRIEGQLLQDSYGLHTICNLYYDTDSYSLIRSSIEAPRYKEKLRLRAYGVPSLTDTVFLEIKKKYNKNVNKRRVSMPLREAYAYFENERRPQCTASCSPQIVREIDFLKNRYQNLRPRLYLAYDRTAFYSARDLSFRVTFDRHIRSRVQDLRLENGDSGKNLLQDGYCLMEVKVPGAMPLWFARLLSELGIFKISFSKYGQIYKTEIIKTLHFDNGICG